MRWWVLEVRAAGDHAMADGVRPGEGWFLQGVGDKLEGFGAVGDLRLLFDDLLAVGALDVEAGVGGADAVDCSVEELGLFGGGGVEGGELDRGGAAVEDEDGEVGHGIWLPVLRLIWISQSLSDVPLSVNDTEHLDPGIAYFVEDQVLADRNGSITGAEVVSPHSGARHALQHVHAVKEGIDDSVGGAFIVSSNIPSNRFNVAQSSPCQPVLHVDDALKLSRTFRLISSARSGRPSESHLDEVASSEVLFRLVERREQLDEVALPLFPKG